ncbi:recombinase RecA [Candidatus Bathyarchaeota archaeon B24-2]|nr:MAG: recombinase RecA [Candidatus Bathyarchaeota archaeon B24-2]
MYSEKQRIQTGIYGLDALIGGGFPLGRTYLVAGETGTGKTTFALQYLYRGIEYGDSGLYVTIDERPKHIIEDATSLGWDLEKFIDENKLLIAELTPLFSDTMKIDAEQVIGELKGLISEIEAKRLAIDPIAPLVLRGTEVLDPLAAQMVVRNYIRRLIFALDELNITTVATSEVPTGTRQLSRYGVEEFLASGVIVLRFSRMNSGFVRELYIRKLRGVNHSLSVYNFVIQRGKGIVIST